MNFADRKAPAGSNKNLPLMRQHYHSARKILDNLQKEHQFDDAFFGDMVLIAFDIKLQFSLLRLKTADDEIGFDEIRHFDNIANSAHILEFLNFTDGTNFTYEQLAALQSKQFSTFVEGAAGTVKKYSAILFDFLAASDERRNVDLFFESVFQCMSAASGSEEMTEDDREFFGKIFCG